MATNGKVAENVKHVLGAAKETQTTWRKIAKMKLNAQNVDKTISLSQDLVTFRKKKAREILEVKNKRNVTFLEAIIIVESYIRQKAYAFVAQRVDLIRQSNQMDK